MHTGTKRLAGLVALAAVGLIGVAACGTSGGTTGNNTKQTSSPGYAACGTSPDTCNSGPRKDGGDIVVALGKYPSTWNTGSSEGNVVETVEQENLILPGTFIFQPSGKIQWNADLLTAEPQVTSTSPQTVVYHLNPNAKWNNGSPINADDFIYLWQTFNGHDKNIPVVGTTGYDSISQVTGSDNGETVTTVYSKTYSDWRGLFTGLLPAWYAKQKVGDLTTDANLEAAFKVWDAPPTDYTGGPYKLSNFQAQQSATFVPNPAWYGKDKPTLKTITFKYITDQTQDIPALQNQEIQALDIQPDQDTVQQLSQMAGVNYEVSAGFAWELIMVNSTSKFMKDPALREAVFDAINAQDMIDKTVKPFFPNAKRLYSHNLFPGEVGYTDVTKTVAPDEGTGNVDKAKSVLQGAGYTFDSGGNLIAPNGGGKVTINFLHTDTQVRDQSGQLVQNYLKAIGITVNDKVTADLGGTLGNFDFDMIQFGFSGSPLLSGNHDVWFTGAGNNFTHWGDPQSDALLDQMTGELDLAKQADLLNQQDAILTKAFVCLPLYQKPNMVVSTNQFINIRDNNAGSYFTYNTQQWGLNASAS
ncbi:MAG TPA: ABC transporter family substrate-binding protein [Micromonosporaceae bacterium]|nr:ABC transporter family substrate-binding protein [Micromonosporaceae bacterium]